MTLDERMCRHPPFGVVLLQPSNAREWSEGKPEAILACLLEHGTAQLELTLVTLNQQTGVVLQFPLEGVSKGQFSEKEYAQVGRGTLCWLSRFTEVACAP